ncbi:DUF1345 domain-containing protein [Massilia sp. CF038]|uniref:DUF1345 domain-containing protein n=1 Tax=Massilia sp. CF038 TaxID=1881045 RepID=UPI0009F9010C|nr:DUF1345 domain-containing protein [Massilia sp. CF038]
MTDDTSPDPQQDASHDRAAEPPPDPFSEPLPDPSGGPSGDRSGHVRPTFARIVLARPRLFGCIALALLVGTLLPDSLIPHAVTRVIVAWNAGALTYLALTLHMMFASSHEQMRTRAKGQDEGRALILAMVVMAAVASLSAIVGELALARDLHGAVRFNHVALAMGTLLTSWTFTQVMFATHYAHDYYLALERDGVGGLAFANEEQPDYGDFLYFSCVIGTSAQTADVSFTSRAMRRTGLLHCVLAFFFNATLLALTINIASGLI